MTVKCTFCNDTKVEPGIAGPCVWCQAIAAAPSAPLVQRFSAVALRFATTSAKDYVSGNDFDRVTAERDSLSTQLEQCQTRRRQFCEKMNAGMTLRDEQADAAQSELVALREELVRCRAGHTNLVDRNALLRQRPDLPVDRLPAHEKLIDLQQRLTAAEQRNADLNTEIVAQVESALRRSFSLGQIYWQQADSDSTRQQNKSDQTLETQAQHILNVVKSISAALKPTKSGASE